jgi:hypothetical protein
MKSRRPSAWATRESLGHTITSELASDRVRSAPARTDSLLAAKAALAPSVRQLQTGGSGVSCRGGAGGSPITIALR